MLISIDSRTIKKGEYFVPIKGLNFDGHDFINAVYEKGAKGVIEESDLYNLVRNKIDKQKPIIIGVAGSIGKSTFRSYLYSILNTKYKTLESDLNTKIGFSLAIMNKFKKHKIVVAEIGIDRIGEMEDTANLIKPNISVITKLGKEHLEYFKKYKNVVSEESKIFHFTQSDFVYINSADISDFHNYASSKFRHKKYNIVPRNKLVFNKINDLLIPPHEKEYLFGIYLICRKHFKFTNEEFIKALKKIKKPKGRFNIIKIQKNSIVIDDTYNAVCDQTIINGVKFVVELSNKLKKQLVVVVPNMVENGTSAETQHKKVAKYLNTSGINNLYIVGENLEYYKKYLGINYKLDKYADELNIRQSDNTIYYIKATRRYNGPELVKKLRGK